jgi:hypothetical protein
MQVCGGAWCHTLGCWNTTQQGALQRMLLEHDSHLPNHFIGLHGKFLCLAWDVQDAGARCVQVRSLLTSLPQSGMDTCTMCARVGS